MADFSQLQPLQAQAQSASSDVANLTQNAPGLLQQLQSNLTSIFSKDNPVMEARGQALSDFLSTPARARAEFLPTNMAQVEGSGLNLSPTQQNAITTSRQSAALAPLAGLNQVITGIYGNIPQLVQNAGNVYQGQISAAQMRAQQLQQQYENAYSQILEQEKQRQYEQTLAEQQRQFDIQEKRLGKGSGSGTGDLSSLIAAMMAGQQQPQEASGVDPSMFDDQAPVEAPQRTAPTLQPILTNQAGLFPSSFGEGLGRIFDPRQYAALGQSLWGGLTGR